MTSPLYDIREGMRVLDRLDNTIGQVDWARMTDEDPDMGSDDTDERSLSFVDIVDESVRADEVPEQNTWVAGDGVVLNVEKVRSHQRN